MAKPKDDQNCQVMVLHIIFRKQKMLKRPPVDIKFFELSLISVTENKMT